MCDEIGLLETQRVLERMLKYSVLTEKQDAAIRRALVEVDITIDNGGELNL